MKQIGIPGNNLKQIETLFDMRSENIFHKNCLYCQGDFTAQKATTKYCSLKCNQRAYKQNKRKETHLHVSESDLVKSQVIRTNLLLEEVVASLRAIETEIHISVRPYLTINEVGVLLNISRTTIYRLTEKGVLPLYVVGDKKNYIKRSDIDKLFKNAKNI